MNFLHSLGFIETGHLTGSSASTRLKHGRIFAKVVGESPGRGAQDVGEHLKAGWCLMGGEALDDFAEELHGTAHQAREGERASNGSVPAFI